MADKKNDEKEAFETPKVLDLEGKEITDEELEEASGGEIAPVLGDCTGGGCCGGS